MAACTDGDPTGGGRGGNTMTLGLTINAGFGNPLSFADADGHVTRASLSDDADIPGRHVTRASLPGDPGTTEEFPPPANVYLFTFLRLPGADTYYFNYEQIENLSATDWTLENATSSAYANTRYRLKQSIAINVAGKGVTNYPLNTDLGRTYAIATPKDKRIAKTIGQDGLFTQWFKDIPHLGLSTATGSSVTVSDGTVTQADYDRFVALLGTAVIDCGDGSAAWLKQDGTTATPWTSSDYRDLYSTPMETVDNADNGTFVWDGTTLHQNDIRLYHAATKYDFQWEVADKDADGKALRSQLDGVYLRKVTLTNVPTHCAIFDPTDLPAAYGGTTTPCVVAKNTAVNKYYNSTITYSGTGTYTWSDATKSNLPNYHSPVETFTTTTPVEWEGVDTTRRDQIFLGRSYAYAFLPSRVNAQTTVNYDVEVCSSTATTDYSSEPSRPVMGTDLAEDQVQDQNFIAIAQGSREAALATDNNITTAAQYRLCEYNSPFAWTQLTMKPSYALKDVTGGGVKALQYDVMRTETYSYTHHRHYFFYDAQNHYLGDVTTDDTPFTGAVFPSGDSPKGAGDIHCVLTPVTLPSKSVTFAPHDAFSPWVRVRAMINNKPQQ